MVFNYSSEIVDHIRIFYVENYYANVEFHLPSIALRRFKDGDSTAAAIFAQAAAAVVEEAFSSNPPNTIVPVIGSNKLLADPDSPVFRLSLNIAQVLDIDFAPNLLSKSGYHRPLHQLPKWEASKSERLKELDDLVHSKPCSARKILIVDDVLTTGATIATYAAAIRKAHGHVAGALVLSRTTKVSVDPLNPGLFDEFKWW